MTDKVLTLDEYKVAAKRSDFEVRRLLALRPQLRIHRHTMGTWDGVFESALSQVVESNATITSGSSLYMVQHRASQKRNGNDER